MLEDVIDGYVTIERAKKDYGVVIRPIDESLCKYEIDYEKTKKEREFIRANRKKWLKEDPDKVLEEYKSGNIDFLDVIRRYGVIIDRKNMTVLYRTTQQFREMLMRRTVKYWK